VQDMEDWRKEVVDTGVTHCPSCKSTDLLMGACAVGAMTVHQEFICNGCQFEFKAMYAIAFYYPD